MYQILAEKRPLAFLRRFSPSPPLGPPRSPRAGARLPRGRAGRRATDSGDPRRPSRRAWPRPLKAACWTGRRELGTATHSLDSFPGS